MLSDRHYFQPNRCHRGQQVARISFCNWFVHTWLRCDWPSYLITCSQVCSTTPDLVTFFWASWRKWRAQGFASQKVWLWGRLWRLNQASCLRSFLSAVSGSFPILVTSAIALRWLCPNQLWQVRTAISVLAVRLQLQPVRALRVNYLEALAFHRVMSL